MKRHQASLVFSPFKDLEKCAEVRHLHLATAFDPADQPVDWQEEEKLFRKAMADVKPMPHDKRIRTHPQVKKPLSLAHYPGNDNPRALLQQLVTEGKGFILEATPEYIEGAPYGVPSGIARRLHSGHFAIQDYVDLHGLGVQEARKVFESFLHEAIDTGKRGILVIHGRGLSSPRKPVLKEKVVEWLTKTSWKKWIIAFASARPCDGGAGATYILLRRQPLTKRLRKKSKRRISYQKEKAELKTLPIQKQ